MSTCIVWEWEKILKIRNQSAHSPLLE